VLERFLASKQARDCSVMRNVLACVREFIATISGGKRRAGAKIDRSVVGRASEKLRDTAG
jgi:hypothetical protein